MKIGIQRKINALLIVGLFSVGLSIGITFYIKYSDYMIQSVVDKLYNGLFSINKIVDMDRLHLLDKDGYKTSEYKKNWDKIKSIQKELKLAYIYLLLMNEKGELYFIYDSADDPIGNTISDSYLKVYHDAPLEAYLSYLTSELILVKGQYTDKWGTFKSGFYPIKVNGKTIGIIGSDYNISDIIELEKKALITLFVILFIGLFVLLFVSLIIRRIIINPILLLEKGSNEISEGNLEFRIQLSGQDELGKLAISFNTMAENLKQSFQTIQINNEELKEKVIEIEKLNQAKDDFLANLSHELKTPLTYIYMYSEMLSSPIDSVSVIEYSKEVFVNTKKLNEYVEDLILITDIESNIKLNLELISPNVLIEEEIAKLSSLALERNISIENNLGVVKELHLDKNLFAKAFHSILKNAIYYNKENGKVIVSSNANEESFIFSIKDTGIGIQSEFHQKIFDKFFRVNSTLIYEVSGVGIGLYISKKIIEFHGSNIGLKSEFGIGSEFIISLPKKVLENV